jgi:uncharacterized protein YecT (DUF1311 family)
MRSASLGITLLLISALSGQQPKKEKFSDCDKSAKGQADLAGCAANDLKNADDELNAMYQQLLRKAAGDAVALKKITAAQRAWLVFRDAQMAAFYPAEDKQKEYGSVFPMCADLLLADLTRERTKMLKEMLDSVEGDVCASGVSR